MRRRIQLTAAAPSQPVTLPWDCVAVMVSNPTGSPVYLRVGGTDIPVAGNTDLFVPAASVTTYGAVGRWFGVAFGDPSLVTTASSAVSGLERVATVEFLSAGEIIPDLGSISFQTLSLSDVIPLTTFAGGITTQAIDLGSWGGAIITVLPSSGSGQGVIDVQVSADASNWTSLNVWAFWPSVPVVVTVPRTLRYLRFTLNGTAISGEPAIAGTYAARATLQEVEALTYSQAGSGLARVVTVPHLGTISNYYVTAGIPSVGLRWQGASGNPLGQAVWYTGPSAAGPWALVAFREQVMGGASASLYRSIGNLDNFLRIDVLDTDVTAGGLAGTLTLKMLPDPDLTSYLQGIFAALGDVGSGAPNVGQSIFHLLQTMDVDTGNLVSTAASINTNTSNTVGAIGTTNALVTATNASLATIKADTTILAAAKSRTESPTMLTAANVAGVWALMGGGPFLVLGWYVTRAMISHMTGGPAGGGQFLHIALGNAVGPVQIIYGAAVAIPAGSLACEGPMIDYWSQRSAGILNNSYTHLWGYASGFNGTLMTVFDQVPP